MSTPRNPEDFNRIVRVRPVIPKPLPREERVQVGSRVPGKRPSRFDDDEWTPVVAELEWTPTGEWFLVGKAATKVEAFDIMDRLTEEHGIQADVRHDGGDIRGGFLIFARRMVITRSN
ncbi:hypothetical protein [Streptomyces sp. NPDC002855]|uniref:hypothetical protein n=1 Tax=Streptomyces sp. NPDC002855 TaxID=3154437 RepID=UPI00332C9EBC